LEKSAVSSERGEIPRVFGKFLRRSAQKISYREKMHKK
jgi:hypothetical protein